MNDKNEINEIDVPVWWKNGGGMMIRRDCLPADHPEHTYNYIRREYNVDPEKYGVYVPKQSIICPHCHKLISAEVTGEGKL